MDSNNGKDSDPKKQRSEQDQDPRQKASPWAGGTWIWIILFAVLIYYFYTSSQSGDSTRIPYSRFITEAEKNNIEEVTFTGNQLSGRFRRSVEFTADTTQDSARTLNRFITRKPAIEDSELMPLLRSNGVVIHATAEDSNWWQIILFILGPWLILLLLFGFFRRRAMQQRGGQGGGFGAGMFGIGRSRARKFEKGKSDTTYEDVAGLENPKKDLLEIVDYLKNPSQFERLGATIPKGVLLMGPPGTGKTMLARATAGEADVPFFSISGSEFIEMFVGVGASRVRDMFEQAKKASPAIIFIDELDSVGRARGTGLGGGHDEREQTLNQILNEMDGFDPRTSVVVIAATNRPDVLDAALTRPGRFDRQITLELPQKNARKQILEIHSREVPLEDDVDLDNLASRTVGFSGADLKNLVNEASLLAGREKQDSVTMSNFEAARDKIILGSEREDMMGDEEKRIVAYHESGHALIARLSEHADPIQKVTIIPRGRALGATEQIPEDDRHNLQSNFLRDRLAVMLGGRVAEQLVFDDVSNGAAGDLKQVTRIARRMITQWGMNSEIGPVWFGQGEEHMFLGREMTQVKEFSEYAAEKIDRELIELISSIEDDTLKKIKDHRKELDQLAEALLESETLEADEIDEILNNR